jgi:hypothetical protein
VTHSINTSGRLEKAFLSVMAEGLKRKQSWILCIFCIQEHCELYQCYFILSISFCLNLTRLIAYFTAELKTYRESECVCMCKIKSHLFSLWQQGKHRAKIQNYHFDPKLWSRYRKQQGIF